MRRLWAGLLIVFLLTFIHSVRSASPYMGRHHHFSWLKRRSKSQLDAADDDLPTDGDLQQAVVDHTYYSVAYYPAWSLYQDYYPSDLPVDRLTHIFYGFADIEESTGKLFFQDKWAALQASAVRDDTGSDSGNGILGELYKLKQQNRHLKIILSVGGWAYSPALKTVVNDADRRAQLVKTGINLIKEHSLDGIDIDWEYADTEKDADNVILLLKELREALDDLAVSQKVASTQYDLVYALPAGSHQRVMLNIADMDKYLSFWNLMAYDFAGSWTEKVLYHSNLYNGTLSTDDAVTYYRQNGIKPNKMVLGMPLYGRGFSETTGINKPHKVIDRVELVDGIVAYRKLPLPSTEEILDQQAMSVYCYDSTKKLLITYDNPFVAREKAKYVRALGLAGGMWWEVSQDSPYEERSLIGAFTDELGVDPKKSRTNNLFLKGKKTPNKSAIDGNSKDEKDSEALPKNSMIGDGDVPKETIDPESSAVPQDTTIVDKSAVPTEPIISEKLPIGENTVNPTTQIDSIEHVTSGMAEMDIPSSLTGMHSQTQVVETEVQTPISDTNTKPRITESDIQTLVNEMSIHTSTSDIHTQIEETETNNLPDRWKETSPMEPTVLPEQTNQLNPTT